MSYRPPMLQGSTERDEEFFAAALRGELRIQACTNCGRLRHPPRPMCPFCHSTGREWKLMSGRGRVWSFIVPHPPLLPAFTDLAPYNVIEVELDEDPTIRLTGNLVARVGGAPNEIDPQSIVIGEPVQVVFHTVEDVAIPQWIRVR